MRPAINQKSLHITFNTGPYTVLPDNSILITANMQSEKFFPSSHQLVLRRL